MDAVVRRRALDHVHDTGTTHADDGNTDQQQILLAHLNIPIYAFEDAYCHVGVTAIHDGLKLGQCFLLRGGESFHVHYITRTRVCRDSFSCNIDQIIKGAL